LTTTSPSLITPARGATLDSAHGGAIRGALGTISLDDTSPRTSMPARLKTLLAIVGPGLIVMVGDNDAGAFSTYGQAGQTYGTKLLWTFLLLVPVIYVNQEMVLRLGAVTGTGFARLILERFGRFWGAFSVIDLFILNALTIVTEFIGIALAASYLGLPKIVAVVLAGLVIVMAASTGSFRRFERVAVAFCLGSLLLIPLYVIAHPPVGQMARGFVIPSIPGGSGQLATVMLLIIGIVGTTVAPWQLFFQQSYIIDHAQVHAVREGRPVDRHRDRGRRRCRADGRDRCGIRRKPARSVHRCRGPGGRAVRLRRPRGGRGLRCRAARRVDARRVRRLAVHRLRGR
jgi:Mn2+/Fe2+ NRAMP family transporter